jgi:hypothetical protein
VQEYPGAITVCDAGGVIIYMNGLAIRSFQKYGGAALIGANLFDCHPESSRTKVKRLLETKERNVYTIEKDGIRKIVTQLPWYQDGRFGGYVEWVVELPETMPHFRRSG